MLEKTNKSTIQLESYFPKIDSKEPVTQTIQDKPLESNRLHKTFRSSDAFRDFFQKNNFSDNVGELFEKFCQQSLPSLSTEELNALDQFCDKKIKLKNEFGFDFGVEISLREFYIDLQNQLEQIGHKDSCLHFIDLIGSAVFYFLTAQYVKRAFLNFAMHNAAKFNPEMLAEFEGLLAERLEKQLNDRLGIFPDDFDMRARLGQSPIPYVIEGLSHKLINYVQRQIDWAAKETEALEAYEKHRPKRVEPLNVEQRVPFPLNETPAYKEKQKRKMRMLMIRRLALHKWNKEPKCPWISEEAQKANTRYTNISFGDTQVENPFKVELMSVDRLNREVMSGSDLHIPLYDFMLGKNREVIPTSPLKKGWQALLNVMCDVHTPYDLSKIDENDYLRLIVDYAKGINPLHPKLEEIYFKKVIEIATKKGFDTKETQIDFIFSLVDVYIRKHKKNDPIARLMISLSLVLSSAFRTEFPTQSNRLILRLLKTQGGNLELPSTAMPILKTILDGILTQRLTIDQLDQVLQLATFIQCNTNPRDFAGKRAIITRQGEINVCLIQTKPSPFHLRVRFDPLLAFKKIEEGDHSLQKEILEELLPTRLNKSEKGNLIADLSTLGVEIAQLTEYASGLLNTKDPYCLSLGSWLLLQTQILSQDPQELPSAFFVALPQFLKTCSRPMQFLNILDKSLKLSFYKALQKQVRLPVINLTSFYDALLNSLENSFLKKACLEARLHPQNSLQPEESKNTVSDLFQEHLKADQFAKAATLLISEESLFSIEEKLNLLGSYCTYLERLPAARNVIEFPRFNNLLQSLKITCECLDSTKIDKTRSLGLAWALTNENCIMEEKNELLINLSYLWLPVKNIYNGVIPYFIKQHEFIKAAECHAAAHQRDSHGSVDALLSIAETCNLNKDKTTTDAIFALVRPYIASTIAEITQSRPSHALTESLKWLIPLLCDNNDPKTAISLLNSQNDIKCFSDQASTAIHWLKICIKLLELSTPADEVYQLWDRLNKRSLWEPLKPTKEYKTFYLSLISALLAQNPDHTEAKKLLPNIKTEDLQPEHIPILMSAYIKLWEGMIKQNKENGVRSAWQRPIGTHVTPKDKERLELMMLQKSLENQNLAEMAKMIPTCLEKIPQENSNGNELINQFVSRLIKEPITEKNIQNQWKLLETFLNDSIIRKRLSLVEYDSHRIAYINHLIDREHITGAQTLFNKFSHAQQQAFNICIAEKLVGQGLYDSAKKAINDLLSSDNANIKRLIDNCLTILMNKTKKELFDEKAAELLESILSNPNAIILYNDAKKEFIEHFSKVCTQLLEVRPGLSLRRIIPIVTNTLNWVFSNQAGGFSSEITHTLLDFTQIILEKVLTSNVPVETHDLHNAIERIFTGTTQKVSSKETCLFIINSKKSVLLKNTALFQSWCVSVRDFLEEENLSTEDFKTAEEAYIALLKQETLSITSPSITVSCIRSMAEACYKRKEYQKAQTALQTLISAKIESRSRLSTEEMQSILKIVRILLPIGLSDTVKLIKLLKQTSFTEHPKWPLILRKFTCSLFYRKEYALVTELYPNPNGISDKLRRPLIKGLIKTSQPTLCLKLMKAFSVKDLNLWHSVSNLFKNSKLEKDAVNDILYFCGLDFEPSETLANIWINIIDTLKSLRKPHPPHLIQLFETNQTLKKLLKSSDDNIAHPIKITCILGLSYFLTTPKRGERGVVGKELFSLRSSLKKLASNASSNKLETLKQVDESLINMIDSETPELFSVAGKLYLSHPEQSSEKLVPFQLTALNRAATQQTLLTTENLEILNSLFEFSAKYSLPLREKLSLYSPLLAYFDRKDLWPKKMNGHCSDNLHIFKLLIKNFLAELSALPDKDTETYEDFSQSLNDFLSVAVKLLASSSPQLREVLIHPKLSLFISKEDQLNHLGNFCHRILSNVKEFILETPWIEHNKFVKASIESFIQIARISSLPSNHVETSCNVVEELLKTLFEKNVLIEIQTTLMSNQFDDLSSLNTRTILIRCCDAVIKKLLCTQFELDAALNIFKILKEKINQLIEIDSHHKHLSSLVKKLLYAHLLASNNRKDRRALTEFFNQVENRVLTHPADIREIKLLIHAEGLSFRNSGALCRESSEKMRKTVLQTYIKVVTTLIEYGQPTFLKEAYSLLEDDIDFIEKPLELIQVILDLLEKAKDHKNRHALKFYEEFNLTESIHKCNKLSKRLLNELEGNYHNRYFELMAITIDQYNRNVHGCLTDEELSDNVYLFVSALNKHDFLVGEVSENRPLFISKLKEQLLETFKERSPKLFQEIEQNIFSKQKNRFTYVDLSSTKLDFSTELAAVDSVILNQDSNGEISDLLNLLSLTKIDWTKSMG